MFTPTYTNNQSLYFYLSVVFFGLIAFDKCLLHFQKLKYSKKMSRWRENIKLVKAFFLKKNR